MTDVDNLLPDGERIIVSLSWRDIRSPKAGGAEVHTHELLKEINKDKFRVVHISFGYEDLPESEIIDGILYLRHGKYLNYLLYARCFYRKNIKRVTWVLDQCNTWRAFTPFWVRREHRIFYIHQLTREIWHIQSHGLFAWVGEHTETAMLRLNRHDRCITVSESTKADLVDVGFDPVKILIVPNGLPDELLAYDGSFSKEKDPTFIYVGRYAKYKGIDDAIRAFGMVKKEYPQARLWLVGKPDEEYLANNLMPVCREYGLSVYRADLNDRMDADKNTDEKSAVDLTNANGSQTQGVDVTVWGFISERKKYELMQRAHALVCPSIREGWGIIISEAGYLGTPGIVYDSPGLRDAVDRGRAGYVCRDNSPDNLADLIRNSVRDEDEYLQMRRAAMKFSSGLIWSNNTDAVNAFLNNEI